jgi:predicted transcriptional regulator
MKQLFLAALNSELKRRGISKKDVAKKLTKSGPAVSKWLSSGTTLKNLEEVMGAYSITLEDLKKYW